MLAGVLARALQTMLRGVIDQGEIRFDTVNQEDSQPCGLQVQAGRDLGRGLWPEGGSGAQSI